MVGITRSKVFYFAVEHFTPYRLEMLNSDTLERVAAKKKQSKIRNSRQEGELKNRSNFHAEPGLNVDFPWRNFVTLLCFQSKTNVKWKLKMVFKRQFLQGSV